MREKTRAALLYAAGMGLALVAFSLTGDNGFAYLTALLGVPIVSGVLAGVGLIRYWHAVAGCLAIVAVDAVFDPTRGEDAAFFAVLAVVMAGIAALALGVTRLALRRRRPAHA